MTVGLSICLSTPARADDKKACVDAYVAAQGLRTDHKLVAARTQLRICARQECAALMQGQMLKDCTGWLAEVESSIPTVVFAAEDASGNAVQNVKVAVDGQVVATALDGRAVDVEPGAHAFTFTDGKGGTATQSVLVLEGTKNQIVRVKLASKTPSPPEPAPPPASPPATTSDDQAPAPAAHDTETVSYWNTQRVIGVVGAGAGVVGVVVGGVLALSAKSQFSNAQNESGTPRVNDSASAVNQGNVASVVMGVGAAVAVAGVVVFFTAPSGAAAVGTDGRQLIVHGTF